LYYDEVPVTAEEIEISVRNYMEKVESSELAGEISEMDSILSEYGIGFEELEASSPRHSDSRRLALRAIKDFLTDEELIYEFIRKKKFPATVFAISDRSAKCNQRQRKNIRKLYFHPRNPW